MIFRWVSGGFQVVSRWSVEQKQQPEQVSHLQLFRGQEGELGLPAEQHWNCSFWRNEVLLQQELLRENAIYELLKLYFTWQFSKLPFGLKTSVLFHHISIEDERHHNCRCVSGASKTCPFCSPREKPSPTSFAPPPTQRC